MKNKLKPCPYCVGTQGHIRVYYVGKMCRVYCDSCIAKTGFYATIDAAMDAWNEGKLLKRSYRSVEQKGV